MLFSRDLTKGSSLMSHHGPTLLQVLFVNGFLANALRLNWLLMLLLVLEVRLSELQMVHFVLKLLPMIGMEGDYNYSKIMPKFTMLIDALS